MSKSPVSIKTEVYCGLGAIVVAAILVTLLAKLISANPPEERTTARSGTYLEAKLMTWKHVGHIEHDKKVYILMDTESRKRILYIVSEFEKGPMALTPLD